MSGVDADNNSDDASDDEACCCPSEVDDDDDQELSDLECADDIKKKKKRKNYCWQTVKNCYLSFQRGVKTIVENKYFQQALLGAILINTLSMGIEYHNQVTHFFIIEKHECCMIDRYIINIHLLFENICQSVPIRDTVINITT